MKLPYSTGVGNQDKQIFKSGSYFPGEELMFLLPVQ